MNETEYIKSRLDDQFNWLEKKSAYNQKMHKILMTIEIILSVTIPALAPYADSKSPVINILIALIGITIASIAGVLKIYKFQEKWINYRSTAEDLKREKLMYLTETGFYGKNLDKDKKFNSLVNRVESILSNENIKWQELASNNEQ